MKHQDKELIVRDDSKFKWFVIEKFLVIESRLSKVEVKAGFWGAIGCSVVLLGSYLIKVLSP